MKIVLEFNDIEDLRAFIRAEYPKLPPPGNDTDDSYPAVFARLFKKSFPKDQPLTPFQCGDILAHTPGIERVKALRLKTGIPLKACKTFFTLHEGHFFE